MSRVDINALLNGFRGKLGNAVFRQLGGKTVVSHRPRRNPDAVPKEISLLQRDRFKRAVAYARIKMQDSETKAEYQRLAERRPDMSAFNAAIADFMRAPKIVDVLTGKYSGNPGDVIVIQAADDFKIRGIHVTVISADGVVIERGEATQLSGGLDWLYIATRQHVNMRGTTIIATATDRPGNETTFEKLLA